MTIKKVLPCLVSLIGLLTFSVAPAVAAPVAAPHLGLHVLASPTEFSSADTKECLALEGGLPPCDGYEVTVTNLGSKAAVGPIVLSDALPAGVKVLITPSINVGFNLAKNQTTFEEAEEPDGAPVVSNGEGSCLPEATSVRCEFTGEL